MCSPRRSWVAALFGVLTLTGTAAGTERTAIPLPEVIVDPNEGTTVGVLPVLLIANDDKSIRSIIAPDVRYNDTTGVYPTYRFYDFPTAKQKYFLIAGKGERRGEYFEATYVGQDLYDGWLDLRGSIVREEDPFERFFGYGNDTPSSNETNYASMTNAATLFGGINLGANLQPSVQARLRQVRIGRGGVSNLPQIKTSASFSGLDGVGGATVVGTRFGLTYDTRDISDIPTEGVFVDGGMEVIDKALGSSSSHLKYGLDAKAYLPLRTDKKYVVALRGGADYLQNGDDAPFFEKNRVGGVHSLRGFGSSRFTDDNRVILQGELRSNVYEREIFGVNAHLEVAPFVDLAKVFHHASEFPLEQLHPVGGVGFRAVVVPQVVAYVDVGTSGGSPSAFTGIDYPF